MPERSAVTVPEDFRRLGYSGDFWMDVAIDPGFDKEPPCLLGNSGWMLLERNGPEGRHGIIVRRDENAVVDAYTRRGPR